MIWWRRWCSWWQLNLLEGRLQRRGYRRLHEVQVAEAKARSRRVIHDLADAVIVLRTVADNVEIALRDIEASEFDDEP